MPLARGVDGEVQPGPEHGREGLQAAGEPVLRGRQMREIGVAADGLRERLPDDAAQQLLAALAPERLGGGVHVGEAEVLAHRVEAVADALEDLVRLLQGLAEHAGGAAQRLVGPADEQRDEPEHAQAHVELRRMAGRQPVARGAAQRRAQRARPEAPVAAGGEHGRDEQEEGVVGAGEGLGAGAQRDRSRGAQRRDPVAGRDRVLRRRQGAAQFADASSELIGHLGSIVAALPRRGH
jgi:hypothetical protein